jgi:hypothetical protein
MDARCEPGADTDINPDLPWLEAAVILRLDRQPLAQAWQVMAASAEACYIASMLSTGRSAHALSKMIGALLPPQARRIPRQQLDHLPLQIKAHRALVLNCPLSPPPPPPGGSLPANNSPSASTLWPAKQAPEMAGQ